MKYIIKDWANNVCFNGELFDSFEEGWGFLFERFPNADDDTFDDYFVLEHKSPAGFYNDKGPMRTQKHGRTF